jgi:cobalamin biosynthesis protein CobD/CbiB
LRLKLTARHARAWPGRGQAAGLIMKLPFVALSIVLIVLPAAAMVAAIWFGHWWLALLAAIVLSYGIIYTTIASIHHALEQDMKRWL